VLFLILIALLAVTCYQDVTSRKVSWVVLLCIGIVNVILALERIPVGVLCENAIFNFCFILFNLAVVFLYLLFRYGKGALRLFDRFLGLGDVLFWGVLLPAFSPLNYIVFYVVSLVVSLVLYKVGMCRIAQENRTVPLAGLQSACYGSVIVGLGLGWAYNVFDDYQLLAYIM
jgi:hypothetical protein